MNATSERTLLIADDDESWRDTLRELFEPQGIRTYLAANGREAVDLFEQNPTDCLLLDMHMPELSGLETLRIFRQRQIAVPCVMVTADSSQQLRQHAFDLHVFRVLNKPLSRDLVIVTIRQALESLPAT